MPQRQNYPYNHQRLTLSPAAANCDSMLCVGQNNLLASFNSNAPNNPTSRNVPRQPGAAYQPNTAYQPVPRQPYQSNHLYLGYQSSNKKGVYQGRDEETDPHPEGFYTTLDQESKKVQYSDKEFYKVDANFVGVKTLCGKCGAPFSSKSRLHKHLKNGCISSL